jgi:hypothetical protein
MTSAEYVKQQTKFIEMHGLKKGDTVKILGVAEDHEDGWGATWNDLMTTCVGKTYKVNGFNSQYGISVQCGHNEWHFPYWLLKKAPKTDAKVKLNSNYTAVVKNGYIEVGCQTVKFDALDRLMKAVEKSRE